MICCEAHGADCRQGRDCPGRAPIPMSAPAPAVVATAKPPQRKYSCAELGVCQSHVERCSDCNDAASGNADVIVTSGLDTLCEQIFYKGLLIAMALFTAFVAAATTGYFYVLFFA